MSNEKSNLKEESQEECCGLCGMIKVCRKNPSCRHHLDDFSIPQETSLKVECKCGECECGMSKIVPFHFCRTYYTPAPSLEWWEELSQMLSLEYPAFTMGKRGKRIIKDFIRKVESNALARGREDNKKLLEEFAEFCHEHYLGTSQENRKWFYLYDNEIINFVDDFLLALKDKPNGDN